MWFDFSKVKPEDLIDKKVVWEREEDLSSSIFKDDFQKVKYISKIVWVVENVNWEVIQIHCLCPNWVVSIVTLAPDKVLSII